MEDISVAKNTANAAVVFSQNLWAKIGEFVGGAQNGGLGFVKNFGVAHESLNAANSLFWLLAYTALLRQIRKERSARGVSFQSLFALMLTELSNLGIMLTLQMRYKVPMSLFLLTCDALAALLSAITYWRVVKSFSSSYEEEKDTFGLVCCGCAARKSTTVVPSKAANYRQHHLKYGGSVTCKFLGIRAHWVTLYAVSAALAAAFHLLRRKRLLPFWMSMWECFTDAVTALALLPQLHQVYNRGRFRTSTLLGRFVVFLLLARLCSLSYWITDVHFHGTFFPGRGVHIVAESLNCLILADFAFFYLCLAKRVGRDEISLPV